MGWNYRKSINLGGGLRLNFSKSGVGISAGVKGFRVSKGPRGTRLYASIPGTGLYYTKNLSDKKRKSSCGMSSARSSVTNGRGGVTNQYPYQQTVTNAYTGETRELRARTQYELNQMVRDETERQTVNEARQRRMDKTKTRQAQVDEMNLQIQQARKALETLIDHTLAVDDKIDWEKEMIGEPYPEFHFDELPPRQELNYKLNFFKSLFMNDKKFEIKELNSAEIEAYERRRGKAIAQYLNDKSTFEAEKNRKNEEMENLKNGFEESDKEAVERYISIVLTRSKYPADFEHDFDLVYHKDTKTVVVNFLFPDIDEFPVTEKYTYDSINEEITEEMMSKANALTFYSNVLYSVGIRTIHEIFESVYTDGVDTVCFNGYIVNADENQCAFAMKTERRQFEQINLKDSLTKIVSQMESRAISDFTGTDQIKAYN